MGGTGWRAAILLATIILAGIILASTLLAAIVVAAVLPAAPALSAEREVAEPAGYRLSDYRAPTPPVLTGAVTVDTAAARKLVETQAAIPVYVLKLDRSTLPGRPWLSGVPPRQIPGGVWLPNVGLGEPGPEYQEYLRRSLERMTGGRSDRGVMFYCLADCWMSWNAAKRALSLGYRPVYWYRDGMDGWTEAGMPSEPVPPLPIDAAP